jgi:hypothetical protein
MICPSKLSFKKRDFLLTICLMTSQNLIVIKNQVIYQNTSSLSCQTQDILATFSRSFNSNKVWFLQHYFEHTLKMDIHVRNPKSVFAWVPHVFSLITSITWNSSSTHDSLSSVQLTFVSKKIFSHHYPKLIASLGKGYNIFAI